MQRVGITGQAGFMGSHLYNYLKNKEDIELIPFEDHYFEQKDLLNNFVRKCEVLVHLAALNRHEDPQVIYDTNLSLVLKLTEACDSTKTTPKIIFASSIQEERDNPYGRSKRDGRIHFEQWAKNNQTSMSTLIIPNVFGPFGKPYYNSVVATFCHQLTHGETPVIHTDGQLDLIYINE